MKPRTNKPKYSPKTGRIRLPNVVRRGAYRKLLELRIQKNPMDEIAECLHKEYGVSPLTVKNWWTHRIRWEKDIFEFPDAEQIAKDIIIERDLLKKYLWIKAHSEDEKVSLAALKVLFEGNPEALQIMHDLGLITKQPESIKLLSESQATELVGLINTALKEHPDAQKKLVEAFVEYEHNERSKAD